MDYLDFRADVGALLAALAGQAGQRVLEVGCGTGVTLVEVAARTAVTLDGTESSLTRLWMARRRLRVTGLSGRVGLYGGDERMLPLAANGYHRVYTVYQLTRQQVGDAAAMLTQIYRVLLPGGMYVAQEAIWKPEVSAAQAAAVYASRMADFGINPTSPQPWSLTEWLALMQGVGFTVVSADLLRPHQIAFPPHPPHAPGMLTRSRLVSRAYQWQPSAVWQRVAQRGKLKAHEEDGRLLENRLIVLRKPSQDNS